MSQSQKEKRLVAEQALAEAQAQKRAMLAEARAKLRELELALDDSGGVSPFAHKEFPEPPSVAGLRLSAAEAGVRYQGRLDVMLAEISPAPGRGAIAGVFTKSETRAAPVLWCQEKLAALGAADHGEESLLFVVNAGNANAFTGGNGRKAVEATAKAAAKAARTPADRVFLASTGVIGEPLPHERIEAKLASLFSSLSAPGGASPGWEDAARAIMTTDTFPKAAGAEIEIAGHRVAIGGVAKGSGMIAPDMATMLGFVFTDAAVAPALLQRMLAELTETSFNAITVDSDTSTSDTVLLAASGRSSAPRIETPQSQGYGAFRRALGQVLKDLALQIVKDGEGLTKFVSVTVSGAKTKKAAKKVAMAIANSPLVKTAWAGEDPNWGRIVMAVGKAGEMADRDRLAIRYGPHPVAEAGWRAPDYDEDTLAEYMKGAELEVFVDLGVGAGSSTVWTCDLTHRYISINADYRT